MALGGMTVGEMLSRISSRELTEWKAWERANGPLGRAYSEDMLAAIHEIIQVLCHVTGMQYGQKNPALKLPVKLVRPHQVFTPKGDKQEQTLIDDIEFDQQFRD